MLYDNYFLARPPFIPANCDKPPTIYSILESIVNYNKTDKTKIKDLAKEGRQTIFDFDYPLTDTISREDFECMILNHFLMRRIGFDTVRAFQIHLDNKLNSIMPIYNKMFDLLNEATFLGDTQIREGYDKEKGNSNTTSSNNLTATSNSNSQNIADRRYSDTPQNELQNVKDGKYITDYNYDTANASSSNTSTSNGTGNSQENRNNDKEYKETITNINMIDTILKLNEKKVSIYNLIYNELEPLFYQLI